MIEANLKFLRRQFGFSQEEVAEKINVSRQSVAKWENGDSLPDIIKCGELASLYETTVDCLLNYSISESYAPPSESDGKYVFGIVKVGERGQIVIPKAARQAFDINAGDKLIVVGDINKGIAIAKVRGL